MDVNQGGDPFPLGASPFGPPMPAAMSMDVDAVGASSFVDASADVAMSINTFI